MYFTVRLVADGMSASGTKQTSNCHPAMSAFGGKADIDGQQSNVCL
jgi:hypothetical protein